MKHIKHANPNHHFPKYLNGWFFLVAIKIFIGLTSTYLFWKLVGALHVDEVPNVARTYKAAGVLTVVVGDHNYGEGSSREHAAMEPRHLGVCAVIVKSFARIHETNLKKQGMLGLTFVTEAYYNLVQEADTFNFTDLASFAPDTQLSLDLVHADGTIDSIKLNHTYNAQQIEWFKAGSALNLIKTQNA